MPNLCYYNAGDEFGFNKPYSEHTAELIDNEVKHMINEQYERAKRILIENKEKHNQLAQRLVEREVIFAEDVEEIFGPRPWVSRSEEILNANKISNEMKQANEAAQKRNEAATEKHEEPQVEAEEKPEDNKEQ